MDELDVDRLIAAGVYDPHAPNAQDRLALVTRLFERGVPQVKIEEVYSRRGVSGLVEDLQVRATGGQGDLVDLYLTSERLTAAEVADRAGVDVGFVVRTRTSMGFRDEPDQRVIPATFVDDIAAAAFGVAIFGEEAILRLTRVMGATAARLAEAAQAMVFAELAEDLLAQPGGEVAMLEANERATDSLPLIPAVFTHAFYEHTNLAADTMRGGFRDRIDMMSLDLTIAFVDVVSSTEWTASISSNELKAALVEFERLASELATVNGCRLVKLIGDEAMIVGFDAPSVCASALALCAAVASDDRLPQARGGVAFGSVAPRDGDYFGVPVNVAARCVKEAEPGQVVVTAEVAATMPSTMPLGRRELRGIDGLVELHVLSRQVG